MTSVTIAFSIRVVFKGSDLLSIRKKRINRSNAAKYDFLSGAVVQNNIAWRQALGR